jgi:desulfoferrodoxin-like iron-binding protein
MAPRFLDRQLGPFLRSAAGLGALSLFGCGNADNTSRPPVVPEWEQAAAGLESSSQCCWSREQVPTADGAGTPEMHLPLVRLTEEDEIEVAFEQAHPMTAEHWITTIYVRNQDAVVIGFRDFGQAQLLPQFSRDQQPELSFAAPLRTTLVRAYSYCNLHGHWASDLVRLAR